MFVNTRPAVADKDLLELDTKFSTSTLEDNLLPKCPARRTLSGTARSPPNLPILTCSKRFAHPPPSEEQEDPHT